MQGIELMLEIFAKRGHIFNLGKSFVVLNDTLQ